MVFVAFFHTKLQSRAALQHPKHQLRGAYYLCMHCIRICAQLIELAINAPYSHCQRLICRQRAQASSACAALYQGFYSIITIYNISQKTPPHCFNALPYSSRHNTPTRCERHIRAPVLLSLLMFYAFLFLGKWHREAASQNVREQLLVTSRIGMLWSSSNVHYAFLRME